MDGVSQKNAPEGSHRLAAWEACGIAADLVLVTNSDLDRAAAMLGEVAEDIDWTDESNLAVLHKTSL